MCVVELEGWCPRVRTKVEAGMVIHTDSERVRLSRRVVLEFLASSVDVSTAPQLQEYMHRYGARPEKFGPRAPTVAQPPKIDNELYVRDYAKCILCYKCVEACGVGAQNTFAGALRHARESVHQRLLRLAVHAEVSCPSPDSPKGLAGSLNALESALSRRLLQGEINPDFMEETPCVRPYCQACLARDGNVEASFGLRA
jgi:NAD-dependent dihydropyrimidine dehydrogenase PreA subunit